MGGLRAGDENDTAVAHAFSEATGGTQEQARQERRLRRGDRGPRLGQSGAGLPHGGAAPADARGDRGAAPAADPGAARAPARGLAAGALRGARPGGARRPRRPLPGRRPRGGRGPAGGVLAQRRRGTCGAPTASRTSPTSWSTASTTSSSTRAAPSRSSSRSTAAWAARRRAPCCCTRRGCRCRRSPSSAPRQAHRVLAGWRRLLQGRRRRGGPARGLA